MRRPILGFAAVCCILSMAPAAQAVEASFAPEPYASAAPLQTGIAAYRRYAQAQADGLVAMTKVLVREIRAGDVDAAQSVYAPAHRYLGRLAPLATSFADLYRGMDATADAYRPGDPDFAGFHRIEQGLFASRSTAGLVPYADRLLTDVLALRARIARLDITPDLLLTAPAAHVEAAPARTLAGGTERFSRTDLWTIEANIDGTQGIFAAIEPQVRSRDAELATRIAARFAETSERIARYKDGCGFKTFDELAGKDRAVLHDAMMSLASDLARLRGAFAIDLSLAELRKSAVR